MAGLANFGARLRDRAILQRSVKALRADVDTATPADSLERVVHNRDNLIPQVLASGLVGYEALVNGDSAKALRLLEAAADSMRLTGVAGPWTSAPLDLEIGRLLLSLGQPAKAEPHFVAASAPWLKVIVEWYLGRTAEQQGDRAQALERYRRVVRWWRGCDPELRPWWEQMRQAQERVQVTPVAQR